MQTLVAMKRLIVLFYNSGKLDGLTFHFSLERIVLRTSCYLARKRRDWITKLRAHVGLRENGTQDFSFTFQLVVEMLEGFEISISIQYRNYEWIMFF